MERFWDVGAVTRRIQEFLLSLQFKGFYEQLKRNIGEESFFPELPRKGRARRIAENLFWYLRYGEINRYYNSYGFDIRGLRRQRDYLPRNRFRQQRNDLNLRVSAYGFTWICVLRDKVVFSAYYRTCLGERCLPRELARILPDGSCVSLEPGRAGQEVSLEALFRREKGALFIKRRRGECGEDCYELRGEDAGGVLSGEGRRCSLSQLQEEMRGSDYIVQEKLRQHPLLARLNPSCVNTLRIITIIGSKSGTPQIFAHFLRLGVNSPVDNRASGGMAVLVDENGVLRGKGFGHHAVYERHPVTGMVFEGIRLPYWEEVKKLVLRAHEALPAVPAIGWDVAFLAEGPVLIEGNDNWEICGVQDTMGGARERWKRFVKQ